MLVEWCRRCWNSLGIVSFLVFSRDLPEQLETFMQNLFPSITQLLVDVNGNYVLLSCFETLNKNRLAFTIPLIDESVNI